MAVNIKLTVFRYMTPCILVQVYQTACLNINCVRACDIMHVFPLQDVERPCIGP
jgi:hypothetical protein